ncbi:hypothetical protein RIF29_29869 [Crotalaria pallida]|uniref:TF-B3 domain-containing protein n=1 Tax=Crotalaria pallida TaxID=3830 RepID=A0AAN9EFT0_CROPI
MAVNHATEAPRVLGELVVVYDSSKDYFDVDKEFLKKHHTSLGMNWNIYTIEGTRYKFYFNQGLVAIIGKVLGGWKHFCEEENINDGDRVVFQYVGFSKFNYIQEEPNQNAA